MRRVGVLIATAGLLTLSACGNGDDDTTAVPDDNGAGSTTGVDLADVTWKVTSVEFDSTSTEAPDDIGAYLVVSDTEIGGNTGCNAFSGDVEVDEEAGVVSVGEVIATQRACLDQRGEIDSAVLGILHGDLTAAVDGDVLTLTNADGDTLTLTATEEEPEDLEEQAE